ncbi:MAG: XRE family transcriptional regulator [Oscillospiraceae bacterium]|nr:XRE family transcriptional regulator [Oscillospiraceae bacterium]
MATTDFSKTVRKRLIDLDKSPDWLCQQVSEKTGLYFDSSYYSKVLRGVYAPEKMVRAICEVLDIPMPEAGKEGNNA